MMIIPTNLKWGLIEDTACVILNDIRFYRRGQLIIIDEPSGVYQMSKLELETIMGEIDMLKLIGKKLPDDTDLFLLKIGETSVVGNIHHMRNFIQTCLNLANDYAAGRTELTYEVAFFQATCQISLFNTDFYFQFSNETLEMVHIAKMTIFAAQCFVYLTNPQVPAEITYSIEEQNNE